MNLSKTAKRFLSSTMAIALAGGSVLAFGNSASAAPPGTEEAADTFDFSGTVAQECALITASNEVAYTPSYSSVTLSDGTTEDRTSQLFAEDSIKFDCNTAKVDITIDGYTSTFTPTVAGGTGAADLQGTNEFKYAINDTIANAGEVVPDQVTTLDDQNTDEKGDIEFNIESTWTPDTGKGATELAAGTYDAEVTITVTAD